MSRPYKQHLLRGALIIATLIPASTALAGLVAHYQFEGNGNDSVGSADGVVGDSISFGPGTGAGLAMTNGVIGFQGPTSIDVADPFDPGSGDFTIAFWVKRSQEDTGNADGIFDALNNTGVGYQANFRTTPDNDKMGIRLDDTSGSFVLIVDSAPLTDTLDWHHFALTVDRSSDQAFLYRDGVATSTANMAALTGAITPDQPLWIGGLNNSGILGLDGSLDDLRFYDHALTAVEIEQLAQLAAPPPFHITRIVVDQEGDSVSLTWNSRSLEEYSLEFTNDLGVTWVEQVDGLASGGNETEFLLENAELGTLGFYRIKSISLP